MRNLSPIGWALLPLKNYANFSGRASRAEFWWFFLFTMIIYVVGIFAFGRGLAAMSPRGAPGSGSGRILIMFFAVFWLGLFIPTLAVQFRRLHDIDRSGWWLGAFWLLYLIYMGLTFGLMSPATTSTPAGLSGFAVFGIVAIVAIVFLVYSIALLVFFCLPGTRGANRYGDDPYGEDVGQVFA